MNLDYRGFSNVGRIGDKFYVDVFCDNCGAKYFVMEDDPDVPRIHRVCDTCFMPMGEFEGLPICEECLSHRMEITEEMRNRKEGERLLELPKMKSESEWKWWQQVARERAFEMMDALHDQFKANIEDNIKLRHKLKACNVLRIRNFLSLLRLRVGFAKLNHLFFKKYYPNSKDEKYWFNIMHNFIFKYERYEKATEGYDS